MRPKAGALVYNSNFYKQAGVGPASSIAPEELPVYRKNEVIFRAPAEPPF